MRIRDLGSLVVAVDVEETPMRGTRAAAMLALLTINTNRRVSLDALMNAAWGDQVTAGSPSTSESHIWRLRQLLEPGRARRQAPSVLVSEAGGYRLVADADSVDSLLFAELAGEVGDLLAAGKPSGAWRRADRALSLWRGRPFEPFEERAWAQPSVARLDELHGQVQERRIQALLEVGAVDQALSELESLIPTMPFREPLWAMQMQALYRGGRIEQALQTYQRARRMLLDEIGTEPGYELQRIQRQVLDKDPSLLIDERVGPAARPAAEVHLPGSLTALVGRDQVRRELVALVVDRRLVTVVGAAGCGKTRVAVEAARGAAPQFPDGVWFVDLAAVSAPELVVDVIASTVGFAASASTTALEDLRNYLRRRRMLLLLDNCEHVLPAVARIVEVALAEADDPVECTVLATSREPIAVPGETIWTLDPLGLPAGETDLFPSAAPAVELFVQRLRAALPTIKVDQTVLSQAVTICTALDGLPLPLELAAARARTHALDDVIAQVTTDPSRLARLGRDAGDHRATVRSTIEWSHQLLSPPEQTAHRRLSVLPATITPAAAAAVIGDDVGEDPDDLLARLAHRSLLSPVTNGHESSAAASFRQLATVRAHAAHALAETGEHDRITRRRNAWSAALIDDRPRLGSPSEVDWLNAVDVNYPTVRATLADYLIDRPSTLGARLASRLLVYWYYRSALVEGERWLRLARDVLADDQTTDLTVAEMALGSALALRGRIDQARPHIEHALARLPDVPRERLVECGETLVGCATACWVPEATDLVAQLNDHLGRVAELTEDPSLAVLAAAVSCVATFAAGRPEAAAREAEVVYERAVAENNLMASWVAAGPPTIAALLAATPADGVTWVNRLIRGHARLGTGAGGSFIETRANFAALSGSYLEATRFYAAGYTHTRRAAMTWPRRPLTSQLLARTREYLSRSDYEQAWHEGEHLTLSDIAPTSMPELDGAGAGHRGEST